MRYISVPVLRWPDLHSCSRSLRKQLDRMEEARFRLSKICQSQIADSSIDWRSISGELLHPLSEKWRLSIAPDAMPERSIVRERSAFLQERVSVEAALQQHSANSWVDALTSAATRLTGGGVSETRSKSAVLSGDAHGIATLFRPATIVHVELQALRARAADTEIPVSLRAVGAMCTLLNIHPFPDGNGRTARLLFNVIINHGQSGAVYIPLCAAFDASMGGFELRLREATYNENWLPLLAYFTAILQWVAESYEHDEITDADPNISHQPCDCHSATR